MTVAGNVVLVAATPHDAAFAYQTKKAAFREYVEQLWGWDEDQQRALHERRFTSQDFRVVLRDGTRVGILAFERKPDGLHLHQLFILPEYQRQGIGSACLRQIVALATAEGMPVHLRVLRINPRALDFYRRHGLVLSGETDTHILLRRPCRHGPGERR